MENHKCINENRLNKTDLELNTIKINMERMQQDLTEIKEMLKGLERKLDERYAGKWTEKVMVWI